MDAQLRLLAEARSAHTSEAPTPWRIDDTTKAVGRSGLALAREALRQARQGAHTTANDDPAHATAA